MHFTITIIVMDCNISSPLGNALLCIDTIIHKMTSKRKREDKLLVTGVCLYHHPTQCNEICSIYDFVNEMDRNECRSDRWLIQIVVLFTWLLWICRQFFWFKAFVMCLFCVCLKHDIQLCQWDVGNHHILKFNANSFLCLTMLVMHVCIFEFMIFYSNNSEDTSLFFEVWTVTYPSFDTSEKLDHV